MAGARPDVLDDPRRIMIMIMIISVSISITMIVMIIMMIMTGPRGGGARPKLDPRGAGLRGGK